jgi:hypothetical protein
MQRRTQTVKNIVLFDEFNEIDFKPSDLLHEYIRLTEADASHFFAEKADLRPCVCPGCHAGEIRSSFPRFGMRYVECNRCGTLYISPRPDDQAMEDYYHNSSARRFWREELSRMTGKKRREKIIKPRFEWILDSATEYIPDAVHIVDINTDQYGYIDALIENRTFAKKTLLNPYLPLDNLRLNDTINVVNIPLEEKALDNEVNAVTIFEVADRTSDVDRFFKNIYHMLKKHGLCFLTGILISGFDLQTLWEKAENIFPPDRMNVFSVEGLKALFKRHDFECLEFSTPGILDVEIVEKAIEGGAEISIPRFMEYLLKNRSKETKQSFQEFLQQNLLSSYGRILLRKI